MRPHAQWTSAATHAVLPLLASDAGVRLQVRSGIASHRRRFGEGWQGGFWLPECAYAPWLLRTLEESGVRSVCVELTGEVPAGSPEHLRVRASDPGVLLVPIDRATISLVWSRDGYPAAGAYRDYHHQTVHHHKPWNNEGGVYDRERAAALAAEHAADFVRRVRARLAEARTAGADDQRPLVVCALDTELLGHWWYEGVLWLAAVIEECSRQGLALLRLDEALDGIRPAVAHERASAAPRIAPTVVEDAVGASSWGEGYDLSTWSGPAVHEMAVAARAAELRVLAARERAGRSAVRELLALQASDWPFMVSREIAAPYALERFAGHERALARALAGADGPDAAAGLRNLAVDAPVAELLAPQ
jgi:1,4-alpha-glucan branching enzyme